MGARVGNAWENVRTSLWLVPALLSAAAAGLAALFLWIDEVAPGLGGLRPWLFGGTADAAQTLLSVIAGSLITVVALAFSITIVAVQQASSQYSPRVIRTFIEDRGNQIVFGAYIATFVYALLVLRQVRAPSEGIDAFVPALAIAGALALAIVCMALLIYYIHHIAVSLQVTTVTDEIARGLRETIERLYPDRIAERLAADDDPRSPALPDAPPSFVVTAREAGYLRAIAVDQLLGALDERVVFVRVRPQVGEFVFSGEPLAEVWRGGAADEGRLRGAVGAAFALDRARTQRQDVLFGIRQLVDIALKAISPGINDPTTAEQCLSRIGDVVARLAERDFPPPWRRAPETGTILLLNRPDFAAVVDVAFSQIRREAADEVHVTAFLLDILARIAPRARAPGRQGAIRRQVDEVLESLAPGGGRPGGGSAADRAWLREKAHAVFVALDGAPRPAPPVEGLAERH